ncbi:MAG TPA: class I SAM-dependent methyltransferase [Chloroflexota bacterium]|jgi:tRNA (cmo5U34)-methyltransferase
MKATPDEIRARFDRDVERFSTLETGQATAVDSPLHLELIAEAAAALTRRARALLDVGCGAGNYALKLLEKLPRMDVTLLDLSRPMLDRAAERVATATAGRVETVQSDVRAADLGEGRFDVIVAASVFHHLRADAEWEAVFGKAHRALRPGGSFWISDHIAQASPEVQALMWRRWGEYLVGLKGEAYRDQVFAYTEYEDTPRPLTDQLDLLRAVGFGRLEVLHKNGLFAAFGAVK